MLHLRTPLSIIFLFAISFGSAQQYWKSQWIPANDKTQVLKKDEGRRWTGDITGIQRLLSTKNNINIFLPHPNGKLLSFDLKEEKIMAENLAEKYPSILAFSGHATNDKLLTVRMELNKNQLFAVIKNKNEEWYVEPDPLNPGLFVVYDANNRFIPETASVNCETQEKKIEDLLRKQTETLKFGSSLRNAKVSLRKYRLALSCTAEYAKAKGGTTESVLTSFVTCVNRVNQILLRDAAVQLELIAKNDSLIFFDAEKDPFPEPNNLTQLLNQNGAVINSIVGANSYDIGHIFTSGCSGGVVGIATLGNVCSAGKARGVTCHYNSNLISITVNVFAHELGHQFSCSHSFNSCSGNQDNVSPADGFEPGGGSTIMSYASACGSDNYQFSADEYFHGGSLDDLIPFVQTGAGASCGTNIPTPNETPVINLNYKNGFSIPVSTPFKLTAMATDADKDKLTYNWEQMDSGPTTPLGEPKNNSPLFRSFPSKDEPFRIFPTMESLLTNSMSRVEILPNYARNLSFRCTVRDNNPQGGAVVWKDVQFKVTDQAGPFLVSTPAIKAVAGGTLPVSWQVAGTNKLPVNCQFVNIRLSIDKGKTFPFELALNTPNDGNAIVTLPQVSTNNARLLIEAADNIFFQISEKEFIIENPSSPFFSWKIEPAGIPLHCLPENAIFNITTGGTLGFDSTMTLDIKSGLPQDASFSFSKNPVKPGDSVRLTLNFRGIRKDTLPLVLTAKTLGGTVYVQETYIQTLSTDFSNLKTIRPLNGQSGIILSTPFEWTTMPNAESYDFQLSTSPRFGQDDIISSSQGLKSGTFTPTQFLADNQLFYWRVRANNACKSGAWTPVATFQTAVTKCDATRNANLLTIPGQGTPTVESSITINEEGTIKDINIPLIRATFEYVRNLRVSLVSPKGTEVILFDQKCALTNKFILGFDDESPKDLICPPDDAIVFKPNQPLAAFKGEPLKGNWILRFKVMKRESIAAGSIESWNIEFCSTSTPINPTLVRSDTLLVKSGGKNLITPLNLNVNSPGVADTALRFIITTLPENGFILKKTDTLYIGQYFTQAEIKAGLINYVHTNKNTQRDAFGYILSNGIGGFIPLQYLYVKIDNTVGFTDINPGLVFNIYPNPTSGSILVSWEQKSQVDAMLEIHDLSGRLIFQSIYPSFDQKVQLDCSNWEKGTYLLTLKKENKIASKLFIIH
ncbi:MAG: T9SS C-terminal target domain-containing protein [Bacteroidetes bacterium]|nr:T9SS C-terminal target domain-containing protein [Bacteroidota bacterium]